MKRFFGYIMIILLFGGSVCGVVFGVQLINANKQIDSLYTEEEVEEKYQEYVDQISDKNVIIDNLNGQLTNLAEENAQHELTISNLQSSISEKDESISTLTAQVSSLNEEIESKTSQISNLNAQIETLSEDKENNLEQIASLQSEKSALETQVSTLTANVSEKEQTIQTLTSEKAELEDEVEELTSTISGNQTTISGLNSQITSLQAEIAELESLLEAYEQYENQSVTVTYYVDNTLFDTQIVTRGETTSQSVTPENTAKYSFVKWQINGEDFDFSTYEFTLNTRIDAVLNYNIYDVTFMYNNEEYYSCDVYGGEYVTGYTAPTIEDTSKVYKGVSLSAEDISYVDLSTYAITSNTTFYVIVEDLYPSIQTFNAEDVQTAYSVASVADYEKLSELTNAGNTFEGVTIYQTANVDFAGTSSWTPIGNVLNPFCGSFNGLNNTIKNFAFDITLSDYLLIVNATRHSYFGLFGLIKGSGNSVSISNVKFENVDISVVSFGSRVAEIARVGVLCGSYSNGVIFDNIIFESGEVSGFTKVFIGDIAGGPLSTGVYNCESHINFSNSSRVYILGGNNYAISNCIAYSNVTNVEYVCNVAAENSWASPSNNQSYGVFTDVGTVYGLPSYEGEV